MTQIEGQIPRIRSHSTAVYAIAATHLYFSYPHHPPILEDINFQIFPGQKVGTIGANGAGKTTLFLTICGILKANAGEVQVFNQPVQAGRFHGDVGLVFQNPADQLFCPSVWDDVAFGVENLGFPPEEVAKRVTAALTTTGVLHLADRIPHHLSGGEKCMVAIASAIAMQPRLVLYDEPSANLDLRARRRLIHFLQESSTTQLIASHDLELILEVCDRVLLFNQGRLIADGSPHQIMSDRPLMEANGLETPPSLKS
ncbi:MAG: energy-coupling factor ABC transporter ATP-binding protein [Jaaginema sp. PMC 1079.18]|nr:energy-coupling factor ABC transporter ATP-binding protein [Jaaginema sp. PMC 1080.18]MEC4850351.1 energy-coupling factor ABC transporter ATP-binding protein [Jaaginema sp. PMC 1079.18]MEC4867149.1 energy-coupling factor ABC transporter ATP-binding protein [Jaaginema sp. PMC 1078.18]